MTKILQMHQELIIKTIVRMKATITKMEEQLDELDSLSDLPKEDRRKDHDN